MCTVSLRKHFEATNRLIVPSEFDGLLQEKFHQLSLREGFGSARDVYDVVYKDIKSAWNTSYSMTTRSHGPMLESYIVQAFKPLLDFPQNGGRPLLSSSRSCSPPLSAALYATSASSAQAAVVNTHIVRAVEAAVDDTEHPECNHREAGVTAEDLRAVEAAREFELEVAAFVFF
jgi:hypothetical protein